MRSDSSSRTRVAASSACNLSIACRMSSNSLFFHKTSDLACSRPMRRAATCGKAPKGELGKPDEAERDSNVGEARQIGALGAGELGDSGDAGEPGEA